MIKLRFISVVTLYLSLAVSVSVAQVSDEALPTENWLKGYGFNDTFLYHLYDRYSKEDIAEAKKRLNSLSLIKPRSKWEGTFSEGGYNPVGFSSLRWHADSGYVSFHIYTCLPELRSLEYGKVIENPEFVELIPEYSENSPRKSRKPTKFIKVRWGNLRFLVNENSLLAFSEKAAGIHVEPEDTAFIDYQAWSNFWVDGDIEENRLKGFPVFPAKYAHLSRKPLTGKIINIRERKIEPEKQIGNTAYYNQAFHYVTVNLGKKDSVSKGMLFEILSTGEEITIIEVNQKNSVGIIVRQINDSQQDDCLPDRETYKPCPKIKLGMHIKTQTGKMTLF